MTASTPAATPLWNIDPKRAMLHTAWLSVILGCLIELVLLGLAVAGTSLPSLMPFVADLFQKVPWSVIVCVGLAFGRAASKANPVWTGLSGLLAAPTGFMVARALHKGAKSGLGVAEAAIAAPSPLLVAGIKGIQYLCLALLVAWLVKKGRVTLPGHLAAGLAVGAVFGGSLVVLMINAAGPGALTPVALLSRVVSEIFFPVGCAAVLYASDVMSKRPDAVPTPVPVPAPPAAA